MNTDEQKAFIRHLAKQLKAYTRELMAYQLVIHQLKELGIPTLEDSLNQARKSDALEKRFQENFAGFDELLPPPDPTTDEKVRELLAKWIPDAKLPN